MANFKYTFCMALAAFIWGSAFVAQRVGVEHIGPYTFNAMRSFIGTLALIPLVVIARNARRCDHRDCAAELRNLIHGGLFCGVFLAISTNLQQIGLVYTTAGKAGFITTFYILFVPILGLFMHKKVSITTWIGVAIALFGMFLLCVKKDFSVGKGELLVLVCAFTFSVHILIVDHFSAKVDAVELSAMQFLVCGILSCLPMAVCEHFTFDSEHLRGILLSWKPLIYAGVLSSGIAYTLQILAQKKLNPTVASLVMSLESVFAALSGWFVLHESLSKREFFGCVLVFIAVILAQLPHEKKDICV